MEVEVWSYKTLFYLKQEVDEAMNHHSFSYIKNSRMKYNKYAKKKDQNLGVLPYPRKPEIVVTPKFDLQLSRRPKEKT